MANLTKQVAEWAEKGLISNEQGSRILSYEAEKPKSSWFMYGLLTLGISVVGLGVISLIAANWHQISDTIKLGGAFSILTLIALFAYKNHDAGKPIVYDASVLALQVFSLATIGLIAQIFHTGGQPYQAILFWSLITLPVVFTTNFMFAPFIWVGSMTGSFLLFLGDHVIKPEGYVALLAPLLSALLAIIVRLIKASEGVLKSSQLWLFMSIQIGLIACEVFGTSRYKAHNIQPIFFQIFYLLSILIITLAWANKHYSNIQKYLITAVILIYGASTQIHIPSTKGQILFAAITLTELGIIGAFFASQKARMIFNLILILMGLRFFMLFIQALEGLAMTGLGLILSGALLIGLATLWQKQRTKIAQWAERITQ